MDKTAEAVLIAGGLYLGYTLVKAQRDINRLTNEATPVLRDVRQISGNVANLSGSLSSFSNAAMAVGQGLGRIFGFSSSSPNAPSQPRSGLNSFQTGNGWSSSPASDGGGILGGGWSAVAPGAFSGGSFTGGGLFSGGFYANAQEDAS